MRSRRSVWERVEGKGAVVALLAREYDVHVRVGAANAGHTFYTREAGEYVKHVMQQIPCAAYANPDAHLCIGPGALISVGILRREIKELAEWRRRYGMKPPWIVIDPRAHVITEQQIAREVASGLEARIGSTSATAREGIGQAQADRAMRAPECILAGGYEWGPTSEFIGMVDVPDYVDEIWRMGHNVMLEGTQGFGLSLTTGSFPFVTSRNTTAAGLLADCGVAPTRLNRCVLVVRTFPIRVAGNSGPWGRGSREISWADLRVDPETERTTVTRKVRRVSTFSLEHVRHAAFVNGATEIVLTFADYLLPGEERPLIESIEEATGVPVTLVGRGPHTLERREHSVKIIHQRRAA